MACLTIEEVHQIAYLTMHGWKLECGEWLKPGFERTIARRHSCGCCERQETTDRFPLEEAYYRQEEVNDRAV